MSFPFLEMKKVSIFAACNEISNKKIPPYSGINSTSSVLYAH